MREEITVRFDEMNEWLKLKTKDTRKVMIISGSPKESNHYAKSNGWEIWEHVSSPQSLHGANNVRVVFCGNYRNRNDVARLRELQWELEAAGKAETIIRMER